jgi:FkbM family methyltransferase
MLIDFKELFPRHNITPSGVLHIGASEGQETEAYVSQGVTDIVYIEALPNVFQDLINHVKKFNGKFTCINACISNKDDEEVFFNVANNGGQSSSMLEFGTHSKEHPTVKFTHRLRLKTSRVDTLFKKHELGDHYDFLNIDLQGSELMALQSMGSMLSNFKWLYLEVNKKELYEGCPLVQDIDNYILGFGFVGVEEKYTSHFWGDKLFIKK